MADLQSRAWANLMRREYFEDFVASGGSILRVATFAHAAERRAFCSRFLASCETDGFVTLALDGAREKLQYPETITAALHRTLPWPLIADNLMRGALRTRGFQVSDSGPVTLASLAELNGRQTGAGFRNDLLGVVEQHLKALPSLAYEYRLAVNALCTHRLDGGADDGPIAPVREWFEGRLSRIATLKRFGIFRKIDRQTALVALQSTTHLLRAAGRRGTVLALDATTYSSNQPNHDGRRHGAPAILDFYNLLRRLIDGAEEFAGLFVLVLGDPSLVEDERRGVKRYKALRDRILTEFGDTSKPNPLAPLVRLAGT